MIIDVNSGSVNISGDDDAWTSVHAYDTRIILEDKIVYNLDGIEITGKQLKELLKILIKEHPEVMI